MIIAPMNHWPNYGKLLIDMFPDLMISAFNKAATFCNNIALQQCFVVLLITKAT